MITTDISFDAKHTEAPDIPFEYMKEQYWKVFLDGKLVGHIHRRNPRFGKESAQYVTKSGGRGEVFDTWAACLRSLEDNER